MASCSNHVLHESFERRQAGVRLNRPSAKQRYYRVYNPIPRSQPHRRCGCRAKIRQSISLLEGPRVIPGNEFHMPVCAIPKSYTHITGIVSSKKAIGAAEFKSGLECDFYLDFDPEVERFEIQPVRIWWEDSVDKRRRLNS